MISNETQIATALTFPARAAFLADYGTELLGAVREAPDPRDLIRRLERAAYDLIVEDGLEPPSPAEINRAIAAYADAVGAGDDGAGARVRFDVPDLRPRLAKIPEQKALPAARVK